MNIRVKIESCFTLELNEQELGALDALFGYDADAFLKVFKEKMGAAYIGRYEEGFRALHEKVRSVTSPALAEIAEVRRRVGEALRK